MPAVIRKQSSIRYNLTCTATISLYGVEFIHFFSKGGQTTETWEDYFSTLTHTMNKKYLDDPSKKVKRLVYVLDNASSHKTIKMIRIM